MPLGVLILGKGSMGTVHESAYNSISQAHVVQVWRERIINPRLELARILQSPEIDIVDICLPTFLHAEVAELAIESGKYVFLEKPVALTMEQVHRLELLEKQTKCKMMVGHVLRYFPEYQLIMEKVKRVGKPGRLFASRRSRLPLGSNGWFLDHKKSGGIVVDLALHDIDFARLTFGPIVEVFAQISHETHALITLRHLNGSVSQIEASWLYHGGFHTRIEVGVEGHLWRHDNHDSNPSSFYVKQKDSHESAVEVPVVALHEDPYTRELRDFVRCIENDEPTPVSIRDAGLSLKVALAANESAKIAQPVRMEDSI